MPLEPPVEVMAPNGTILVPGCCDTDGSCSNYKQQEGCLHNSGLGSVFLPAMHTIIPATCATAR